MSQKIININPSLMKNSISKNKTAKRKEKQNTLDLAPKTSFRKKLMSKINNHMKKSQEQAESENKTDFEKHVDYLVNLSKNKSKQKASPNKENNLQNLQLNIPPAPQPTSQPAPMTTQENVNPPPFGCLKGGHKPTFREWKKQTQKYKAPPNPTQIMAHQPTVTTPPLIAHHPPVIPTPPLTHIPVETTHEDIPLIKKKKSFNYKGGDTKNDLPVSIDYSGPNFSNLNLNPIMPRAKHKRTYKHRKTVKHIYGKYGTKVGILIKDLGTRKKITDEQKALKNKNIVDVKSFLRQKNLIKSGSSAPPDILRCIYENSILSGDIHNKNGDNMLYNYLHNPNSEEIAN